MSKYVRLELKTRVLNAIILYSLNTWVTLPQLSSFTTGSRRFTLMLITTCVSSPQSDAFMGNNNKQWWRAGEGAVGRGKAVISSVAVELVQYWSSTKQISDWWKKWADRDFFFFFNQVHDVRKENEWQESAVPRAYRRQSPLWNKKEKVIFFFTQQILKWLIIFDIVFRLLFF